MVFVEKQTKAGNTYYYLTTTRRVQAKFKKERVLLSKNKPPTKKQVLDAQQQFSTRVTSVKTKHFIWERPCVPHIVFIAAEVCVRPQKKVYGHDWGDTYGFFENNMVRFVWPMKKMISSGIHIINNLLDETYFNRVREEWKKKTEELTEQMLPKLKECSDKELLTKQKTFCKVFKAWWAHSQFSDNIAYGAEYLLKKKVDEKDMGTITIPSKLSYTTQEEIELLKIAIEKEKEETMLKKHEQKYYWIKNNYVKTTYLDKTYFKKQVEKIRKEFRDPVKEIEKILSRQKQLIKEKEETLLAYALTEKEKKLIHIIEYFSIFQDKRKAISLEANDVTDRFIKELERRTGISRGLLLYASPYEYEAILLGHFDISILQQRKEGCVILITEKKQEIIHGKQYGSLKEKILGKRKKGKITEFEGRRAQGGKVSGTVKIILDPRQAESFPKGHILVTTMTSPDFLPIMKKAKAIITDEGGITSHAAVVSRELGIPCIVGTQRATHILKDGQHIEVNASHGLIKIID